MTTYNTPVAVDISPDEEVLIEASLDENERLLGQVPPEVDTTAAREHIERLRRLLATARKQRERIVALASDNLLLAQAGRQGEDEKRELLKAFVDPTRDMLLRLDVDRCLPEGITERFEAALDKLDRSGVVL